MNFIEWYQKRGFRFIYERATKLSERYSFTPVKAMARIRFCVDRLSAYRCYPTFFVPAIVVKRNSDFIHELQEKGCEIGVHGYQHIDMRSISPKEACFQLNKAKAVFRHEDISIDGFRCPYLSFSDEILRELQPGEFNYSSNRAIAWMDPNSESREPQLVFDTVEKFYHPASAQSTLSLPYQDENILEIPVSVPDDLQLRDGMNFTPDEISSAFSCTFNQTHQRGELFNLMFHPELASMLIEPFFAVLGEAFIQKQRVWVTQLRDISKWWHIKENYKIQIEKTDSKYRLMIDCPRHATLLVRGIDNQPETSHWGGRYQRVNSEKPIFFTDLLPLVGISPRLPKWVHSSLKQLGYISINNHDQQNCSIQIKTEFLNHLDNPVKLIEAVEALDVPLIRFWPWPDGCQSALCLSGDLDALSLIDYATRLL